MRRPGCRRRWEKTGRARVVWKGHPRVSWRKGASEYAGWRPEVDILRYAEIPSRVTRQPTTPRNGLVVPDLISDLVVGDTGIPANYYLLLDFSVPFLNNRYNYSHRCSEPPF